MASINLSGILRDPLGEVSYGNKIRFTHTTTTGETLKGFRSVEEVVIDGAYDIDLEYGNVSIETFDKLNRHWVYHGNITINSDTPATSLPALLGITTPATDADLLVFQALVADAESSKLAAELAQEETEALFTGFNDSVADSLAAVLPPEPDVYLPFGNSIVKTLSGALSFERDSSTGNINKSGVLETLGVDYPAITSNGLSVYESYTNSIRYSEDFSQWTIDTNVSIEDDFTTEDGYSLSKISISDSSGYLIRSNLYDVTDGENLYLSAIVSISSSCDGVGITFQGGSSRGWQSGTVNFDGDVDSATGGSWDLVSFDNITGNIYKLEVMQTIDTTTTARVSIHPSIQDGGASVGDYLLIHSVQASVLSNTPYVATNASTATRSHDTVLIQTKNNFPASGNPFSVVADVVYTGKLGFLFETESRGFGAYLDSIGQVVIRGESAIGPVARGLTPGDKYRLVVVFDGSTCTGYVDGVPALSTSLPDVGYSPYENLIIGSNSDSQFLNSTIENFKIWHKALTPSQIASLGGAE